MSHKNERFEPFVSVTRSLSCPNCGDSLETLARGEKNMDALAQATGMSVAS